MIHITKNIIFEFPTRPTYLCVSSEIRRRCRLPFYLHATPFRNVPYTFSHWEIHQLFSKQVFTYKCFTLFQRQDLIFVPSNGNTVKNFKGNTVITYYLTTFCGLFTQLKLTNFGQSAFFSLYFFDRFLISHFFQ